MKSIHLRTGITLAFLAIGGVGALHAESVEIAPFYGLRFGGNLVNDATGDPIHLDAAGALGATANIPLPGLREKLELLYSHQSSGFSSGGIGSIDVDVDVYQAGLLKEYMTEVDKFRPFLVGTLGLTHFAFESPFNDKDLFSVGLGGGFKYLATEHVGFRLDARAYVSFVEGSGSIACGNGCVVHYQSSTFIQGEITPSVVVSF